VSAVVRKLYRDAGLTPPKGKGIHTLAFHKCVISIKKKIKTGKIAKTYVDKKTGKKMKTNPYKICMERLGIEKAVHKSHRR